LLNHSYSLSVYYEDTDAAALVYYANYLKFAERARTNILQQAGINQAELLTKELGFVVSEVNVKYHLPARLEDKLQVVTNLIKLGGATINLQQQIFRGETLLVNMQVKLACIKKGIPCKIPDAVKKAFS